MHFRLKNKAVLLLAAAAVLVIRCASQTDMVQSWVGADQSALVAEWGEPERIIEDKSGDRIFVYVKTEPTSLYYADNEVLYGSDTRESGVPDERKVWRRTYMFSIGTDGIVYDWDFRREQIISPVPKGSEP